MKQFHETVLVNDYVLVKLTESKEQVSPGEDGVFSSAECCIQKDR